MVETPPFGSVGFGLIWKRRYPFQQGDTQGCALCAALCVETWLKPQVFLCNDKEIKYDGENTMRDYLWFYRLRFVAVFGATILLLLCIIDIFFGTELADRLAFSPTAGLCLNIVLYLIAPYFRRWLK